MNRIPSTRRLVGVVALAIAVAGMTGFSPGVASAASHSGAPDRPALADVIHDIIAEDGIESAIARYRALREQQPDDYDFGETQLNTLGYRLMGERRFDDAIAVLRLNADAFPDSPNAQDSLAEAYLLAGDDASAIATYERLLAIVSVADIDEDQRSLLASHARVALASLREAREFDFWLGTWLSTARMQTPSGRWISWSDTCRVARVADGNAIIDYWGSPLSPNRALYIRTYDVNTGKWQITGVGSRGLSGFTIWEGTFHDGWGEFFNDSVQPGGGTIITRITFSDIADGSFHWELHRSTDGGESWQMTMERAFTRVDRTANIWIR